jgi:FAD/FMN-containing dehydrogenase
MTATDTIAAAIADLTALLGADGVALEKERRQRLSRDFCWYSPILDAELKDVIADAIVFPRDEGELLAVVKIARRHGVPLTARGAGTGNYGQAMPLAGGIVVDLTRMNRVPAIGDGWMRVEAGARMGAMEEAARARGQELRLMPSTFEKSTIGGFLCGGAGGIGSATYGWLWEGDNVTSARMATAEAEPRMIELAGDEVAAVLHSYGVCGILSEVTLPLVPRTAWAHVAFSFPTLAAACEFGRDLTADDTIARRLVSVSEASMAPLFNGAMPLLPDESRHPALLIVGRADLDRVQALAASYGGIFVRELPETRHPTVSDFSYNHVTLWAKKADPAYTYLQASFTIERMHDQVALVKQRYGEAIIHHFEFISSGGAVAMGGLLLWKFESSAHLDELMRFLTEIGVWVSNPHTVLVEGGTRRDQRWEPLYRAKSAYDPDDLLNPGKLYGSYSELTAAG